MPLWIGGDRIVRSPATPIWRLPSALVLMPNPPRHIVPNVPLHVTQRGVDRCATFLTDEDFAYYLWVLRGVSVAAGCAVHAYALMTNHVHLLLTPREQTGPARLMRALGVRYVRYFNDRYRRTGTLWEGRYRSTLVDTDSYFFACSRYIERNPQRAGLTDDPGDYHWSSFRCNAFGEPDQAVTAHALYIALGSQPAERCGVYRQLFDRETPPALAAAIRTGPVSRPNLFPSGYQDAIAMLSRRPSGAPIAAHTRPVV